jgi:hypothetical protein
MHRNTGRLTSQLETGSFKHLVSLSLPLLTLSPEGFRRSTSVIVIVKGQETVLRSVAVCISIVARVNFHRMGTRLDL